MSVEFTCPVCRASWKVTTWDMSERGIGYDAYAAKAKPKKRSYTCLCGYVYDPENPPPTTEEIQCFERTEKENNG